MHACIKIIEGEHVGKYAQVRTFTKELDFLVEVQGFGEVNIFLILTIQLVTCFHCRSKLIATNTKL
jgi:hypothetical protein